jgi:phage terminase large subunit-like protein
VKLACQRHLKDLKQSKDPSFPYRLDEEKAEAVCAFAELMPHVKGPKAGQLIVLELWQKFFLQSIFGWVHKKTGNRRFGKAYLEVARGNAKSTLAAVIGLYMLVVDREGGAEVYSAATKRDQARIIFDVARQMARKSPGYRDNFNVHVSTHNICQPSSASKFEPLSAEADTLDGLNIHAALVDELHAHRTRDVYDVLETGCGKREQSLLLVITTAGNNRAGICYEVRTYITKILEVGFSDETFFGIIYTIDDEDDWTDPKNWPKANPNWGISVMPEKVAPLATKAMQMPSAQNNFKTKHLNVWVNAAVALIDMLKWAKCEDPKLNENDFAGRECILGLDLANKIDIAAKAKLFWEDFEVEKKDTKGIVVKDEKGVVLKTRERHYYAFLHFYLCEDAIESGKNSQYEGWQIAGLLTETPGNETDYWYVGDDILIDASSFNVLEVCYDPYQAPALIQGLTGRDDWDRTVIPVEIAQNVKNFSPALKELIGAVAGGRFHHTGHPILSWMISNLVGKTDHNDNIFPRKERDENKIDGVIAILNALTRAMNLNRPEGPQLDFI